MENTKKSGVPEVKDAINAMADEITNYARMGPGRQDLRDRVSRLLSEFLSNRPSEAIPQWVAAAYVDDRREQYKPSSGIYEALSQVAAGLRRGDHVEAWKHGELDDLAPQRSTNSAQMSREPARSGDEPQPASGLAHMEADHASESDVAVRGEIESQHASPIAADDETRKQNQQGSTSPVTAHGESCTCFFCSTKRAKAVLAATRRCSECNGDGVVGRTLDRCTACCGTGLDASGRPSEATETEEQRFLIERTCDVTPGLAVAIDAHREAALARQAKNGELAVVCEERDRARRDRDYWRAEAEKARSTDYPTEIADLRRRIGVARAALNLVKDTTDDAEIFKEASFALGELELPAMQKRSDGHG